MDAQYIGQNVKRLRSERGITQQQLGDALGIGFQAVSKWECGFHVPDISIIPAIADFFEVSIDELFMEKAVAYRHKAERLLSVYESDSSCEDNLKKANRAYEELFLKGQYDKKDLADYTFLNELRMEYYASNGEIEKAKETYIFIEEWLLKKGYIEESKWARKEIIRLMSCN